MHASQGLFHCASPGKLFEINQHNSVSLSAHRLPFMTWFISEDQTGGCNPSPRNAARGDHYSVSDSHISRKKMHAAGTGGSLSKGELFPQSSAPTKGAFLTTAAAAGRFVCSCCFVWVFSALSRPASGPTLCFPKVNFQSRHEPAAVCVALCTSFPKQPPSASTQPKDTNINTVI